MNNLTFSLRAGRPEDLDLLHDIDEDAGAVFREVGISFALTPEHPFVLAEVARWTAALSAGRVWLAVTAEGTPVGFAACGFVDGEPYLDQVAVRTAHARRGAGKLLLQQAILWSGARPLWLTTYAHIAWNGPYYERAGFQVVSESECGPELRAVLREQRLAVPFPEQRVAMRREPSR